MAELQVGELAATGTLVFPRVGLATARVTVAVARGEDPPWQPGQQVSVSLVAGQESATWRMTVCSVGPERGLVVAVLVGGKARLDSVLQPRYYLGPDAALVFRDLLEEAGEEADPGPGLDRPMIRWLRPRMPAYDALRHLVAWLGPRYAWRATPEGRIWCGLEQPRDYASADELDYEADDPGGARAVVGFRPGIVPGVLVDGALVDRVVHHVLPSRRRTELWLRAWTG